MRGLTSEFGMGSGISLSLLPPSKIQQMNQVVNNINRRLKLFSSIGYKHLQLVIFLYIRPLLSAGLRPVKKGGQAYGLISIG